MMLERHVLHARPTPGSYHTYLPKKNCVCWLFGVIKSYCWSRDEVMEWVSGLTVGFSSWVSDARFLFSHAVVIPTKTEAGASVLYWQSRCTKCNTMCRASPVRFFELFEALLLQSRSRCCVLAMKCQTWWLMAGAVKCSCWLFLVLPYRFSSSSGGIEIFEGLFYLSEF